MLKRLAPRIRKHIARLIWPKARGIVERDGVLYLLHLNHQPENWNDKHILLWGAGEPEQRAFLFENIRRRECEIFLDIGANGVYMQSALRCRPIAAHCCLRGRRTEPRPASRTSSDQRRNRTVQTRIAAVSDHMAPSHSSARPPGKSTFARSVMTAAALLSPACASMTNSRSPGIVSP